MNENKCLLCYTALVLAVGCYLTVLALNGRRLAGEAGAHEICSLELSLRCEVRWLHAGISPAAVAIYTQSFCLGVQQCRSAKGTRTSSSRALAEDRPRSEGKDTHYTPLPLKYNFSRKVKVFFEAWLQAVWLGVLFCLLRSVLDLDCFGCPALKLFSFVLMCNLLKRIDVVCSRPNPTLNLQCDKCGTRKKFPEEKHFTLVT